MNDFSTLNPKIVWSIFSEILKIPRPSKHEEKIRAWLIDFASRNNINCHVDKTGNVIMSVPATEDFADRNGIIFQAHMDMVCEKNAEIDHDFMSDPINAYLDDDGWVKAKGTTLGADCGIGMAIALALLTDKSYSHPMLQALFTYDEEQGLTGAMNLDPSEIEAKYMINLDSEDEGQIFIGCAGGIDTIADFEVPMMEAPKGASWFNLKISGLQGGHSGDDIEKGRASAVKLLGRILYSMLRYDLLVSSIDGGKLRNAISRDASALVALPCGFTDCCKTIVSELTDGIKNEYRLTDSEISISFSEAEPQKQVYDKKIMNNIIRSLQSSHHGVYAMSFAMPGIVETSTNLASIKMTDTGIRVVTSQRSFIESAKMNIASIVEANFVLAGAKVTHTQGYPGWNPNPDGYLVKTSEQVYKKLFGKDPWVRAIHAGLECGLFIDKKQGLQAISIGPTLRGVHSPSERLEAQMVEKIWNYLGVLIKELR